MYLIPYSFATIPQFDAKPERKLQGRRFNVLKQNIQDGRKGGVVSACLWQIVSRKVPEAYSDYPSEVD